MQQEFGGRLHSLRSGVRIGEHYEMAPRAVQEQLNAGAFPVPYDLDLCGTMLYAQNIQGEPLGAAYTPGLQITPGH